MIKRQQTTVNRLQITDSRDTTPFDIAQGPCRARKIRMVCHSSAKICLFRHSKVYVRKKKYVFMSFCLKKLNPAGRLLTVDR